jgi:hypothetical protein
MDTRICWERERERGGARDRWLYFIGVGTVCSV